MRVGLPALSMECWLADYDRIYWELNLYTDPFFQQLLINYWNIEQNFIY
jgi:hypothetical protein